MWATAQTYAGKTAKQARWVKTVKVLSKGSKTLLGSDRRFHFGATQLRDRYRLGHLSVIPEGVIPQGRLNVQSGHCNDLPSDQSSACVIERIEN